MRFQRPETCGAGFEEEASSWYRDDVRNLGFGIKLGWMLVGFCVLLGGYRMCCDPAHLVFTPYPAQRAAKVSEKKTLQHHFDDLIENTAYFLCARQICTVCDTFNLEDARIRYGRRHATTAFGKGGFILFYARAM